MFKNAYKLPTNFLTDSIPMRNPVGGGGGVELGLMEAGVSMPSFVKVVVSDGDVKCRRQTKN